MRIDSKEKLLELCEAEQKKLAACDCRILVCSGTGCIATGSQKIYEKFLEVAKDAPGVSIPLHRMTRMKRRSVSKRPDVRASVS